MAKISKRPLTHSEFEEMLLPVRVGINAAEARTSRLPVRGAVAVYPTAVVAGNHKDAERGYGLLLSHEPGTVFTPGTTTVTVEGRVGTYAVNGSFTVAVDRKRAPAPATYTVRHAPTDTDAYFIDRVRVDKAAYDAARKVERDAHKVALAELTRTQGLTKDDARKALPFDYARDYYATKVPVPGALVADPADLPWFGDLPASQSLPAEDRDALADTLDRHASVGMYALGDLLSHWEAAIYKVVRTHQRRIDMLGHEFTREDAVQEGWAAAIREMRRHASWHRHTATFSRVLLFAVRNKTLERIRRVRHTQSAETGALRDRLHALKAIGITYNTVEEFRADYALQTERDRLIESGLSEDDATAAAAAKAAAGTLPEPRYGIKHFQLAWDAEPTFTSLNAPAGNSEDAPELLDRVPDAVDPYAGIHEANMLETLFTARGLAQLEQDVLMARYATDIPTPWPQVVEDTGFAPVFAAAFTNPESANELMRAVVRGAESKIRFDADQFMAENHERAYTEALARRQKAAGVRAAVEAERAAFGNRAQYLARRKHRELSAAWMELAAANPDVDLDPVPPFAEVLDQTVAAELARLPKLRRNTCDPAVPLPVVAPMGELMNEVLHGWLTEFRAELAEQSASTQRRFVKALDRARERDGNLEKTTAALMARIGERARVKMLHPAATLYTPRIGRQLSLFDDFAPEDAATRTSRGPRTPRPAPDGVQLSLFDDAA